MPVSGRRIKAALLKTPPGFSGTEVKPFQKTLHAAVTGSPSLARPTGLELRVAISHTITRMAAARKMDREMTSVPHLRSVLFRMASLLTAPFTALEGDVAAETLR